MGAFARSSRKGALAMSSLRGESQSMAQATLLSFSINGDPIEVAAPPHWTLLEVLRYRLDLVGTKQGCDKGDCGACTVQVNGRPVLACLTMAGTVEGRRVDTVEGLGYRNGEVHPLQDAFDRWDAAQCGFCTPGILMAADALLAKKKRSVVRLEVQQALAGNLCRCTGYTKILDAIVDCSEQVYGDGDETDRGDQQ